MDHLANFWKYVHKLVGALRPPNGVYKATKTFHCGEASWDINQTIRFLAVKSSNKQLLDGSNWNSPLIHR